MTDWSADGAIPAPQSDHQPNPETMKTVLIHSLKTLLINTIRTLFMHNDNSSQPSPPTKYSAGVLVFITQSKEIVQFAKTSARNEITMWLPSISDCMYVLEHVF